MVSLKVKQRWNQKLGQEASVDGVISLTNTKDQTRVGDEWDINVLLVVQVQFWTTKRYHRLINRTEIRDYRRQ